MATSSTTISALAAAVSVTGSEVVAADQGSATVKVTLAQIAALAGGGLTPGTYTNATVVVGSGGTILSIATGSGGGGGSIGAQNTPGFGAATVTDSSPATTLTDYNPTGLTAATSEISINTSGTTVLNTLTATGRVEGSTLVIDVDGTGTLQIPNSGAGTAANQFVTAGGATQSIAAGGSVQLRRHNSKWRLM